MGCSTPRTTKAGPSHGAHKVVDIDSVRDTCSNLSPSSRPPPHRSSAQVKSQTDRGQASKACLGLVCFSKSHRGQDTRSTHLPLVRVSTNYRDTIACLLDRGLLQICITHLYPSWLLHIHIKDDAHTRLRSKDKAQSVPECSRDAQSRDRSPERRTFNEEAEALSSVEIEDRPTRSGSGLGRYLYKRKAPGSAPPCAREPPPLEIREKGMPVARATPGAALRRCCCELENIEGESLEAEPEA
jgi:hypothetical protein